MARLSRLESETIINFNQEERDASIFTYDVRWQNHLEKKLKLKPIMVNGFGGKEYIIDKKRIKMPRKPKLISTKQKKQLTDRFANARNRQKSLIIMQNFNVPNQKMGKTTQ